MSLKTLYLFTEARYTIDSDGLIFTNSSVDGGFLRRYFSVFDTIHVVARICEGSGRGCKRVNESGVSFVHFPSYASFFPFRWWEARRLVREIKKSKGSVILRVPSMNRISRELRRQGVSFGVEVIGDPYDVFRSMRWPFKLLASVARRKMREEVRYSALASYVTERYLQHRYHGRGDYSYSSIELSDSFFSRRELGCLTKKDKIELLCVGSLNQLYKAPDVLLSALRVLKERETIVSAATWIGDGRFRQKFEDAAQDCGVDVSFIGYVRDKDKIIEYMHRADIFLMISRSEGLPRALIEAMAVGLPCIGTRVGGIPELLDSNALIAPDSPRELAAKIIEFSEVPDLAFNQAERNCARATRFRSSVLEQERSKFYADLISATEKQI